MITEPKNSINDRAINTLADLFLYAFGWDRRSIRYKRVRAVVILIAKGENSVKNACSVIAENEQTETSAVLADVRAAVTAADPPVEEVFNTRLACLSERPFMPYHKSPDNVLAFLGTTFLYLIETNYKQLL